MKTNYLKILPLLILLAVVGQGAMSNANFSTFSGPDKDSLDLDDTLHVRRHEHDSLHVKDSLHLPHPKDSLDLDDTTHVKHHLKHVRSSIYPNPSSIGQTFIKIDAPASETFILNVYN